MKLNKTLIYTLVVLLALALVTGLALAEDGIMFRRNVSKTPEGETEKAAIYMMDFYVPAQASTGLVGPVDNISWLMMMGPMRLRDPRLCQAAGDGLYR
jgi:hypothetical protein